MNKILILSSIVSLGILATSQQALAASNEVTTPANLLQTTIASISSIPIIGNLVSNVSYKAVLLEKDYNNAAFISKEYSNTILYKFKLDTGEEQQFISKLDIVAQEGSSKKFDLHTRQTVYNYEDGNRQYIGKPDITIQKSLDPITISVEADSWSGTLKKSETGLSLISLDGKETKLSYSNEYASEMEKSVGATVTVKGIAVCYVHTNTHVKVPTGAISVSDINTIYKYSLEDIAATGKLTGDAQGTFIVNGQSLNGVDVDKLASMENKLVNITGKQYIKSSEIERTRVDNVIYNTDAERKLTIEDNLYNYIIDTQHQLNTYNAAVNLHGGVRSNNCVFYASEALRNVGVNLPKDTGYTAVLTSRLEQQGWTKERDFKKLLPGSICFTTDINGGNGDPTHTYIFMGWVTSGEYGRAYICDNQAKSPATGSYHVRNIAGKDSFFGKDAFAYFMVSPDQRIVIQ